MIFIYPFTLSGNNVGTKNDFYKEDCKPAHTFYGWSRGGTVFKIFAKVDEKSGIPRPALWLSFAVSVFWTLPFPSWSLLVNVASVALILTFAIAPVSFGVFRRFAPDLKGPFYC